MAQAYHAHCARVRKFCAIHSGPRFKHALANLFDHRWTWRAAERAGLVPRRGHPHAYLDDMLWDIMNAITMPGAENCDELEGHVRTRDEDPVLLHGIIPLVGAGAAATAAALFAAATTADDNAADGGATADGGTTHAAVAPQHRDDGDTAMAASADAAGDGDAATAAVPFRTSVETPCDDDADGACKADKLLGCTEPSACNYDSNPTTDTDNTLCEYPIDLYGADNLDCDGNCLNDSDGDLVCDEDEIVGCQEEDACNYDATATDAGTCDYPLDLYGKDYVDCDGVCLNDADGDQVCDEDEVEGCTDEIACNFIPEATDEDGSCTYPDEFYLDCDGACINDEDGDGLCDEVEALIPPDYNPDWNGDYCYTVADLTHLLCLFGTCGLDTTGGPDYNPFFGEDSCYSAFDLIPFLTLYQTCLEVEEGSDQPTGNQGDAPMGDGMNDEGVLDDDE